MFQVKKKRDAKYFEVGAIKCKYGNFVYGNFGKNVILKNEWYNG
jgi:hypothetical protein